MSLREETFVVRGLRADFFAVVCLSRKWTFAMLTVVVIIIFTVAIAKGVAFFKGEREKETASP